MTRISETVCHHRNGTRGACRNAACWQVKLDRQSRGPGVALCDPHYELACRDAKVIERHELREQTLTTPRITNPVMHCGFTYHHAPHTFCYGTTNAAFPDRWPTADCPGFDLTATVVTDTSGPRVDSDTMTEPWLQCPSCAAVVRAHMAPPAQTP